MKLVGPMRVLHVNTARTWRGGERQVLLLAEGLAARNHVVLIVCQPGSVLSVRARARGIAVHEVRMRGEWDLIASARLARAVRRFRTEICHVHTAHAHALGLLARFWTRMPPTVVSRRVDFRPGGNPLSSLKYRLPGQRYVAVSENVRQVLISAGVNPGRVRTVRSGVPLPAAMTTGPGDTRVKLGIGSEARIVTSIAAMAPHKDHSTLLQAAAQVIAKYPEVRFLLVGEGELSGRVSAEVSRLGLGEHVTMAGFRKEVGGILSLSSVYVSSSRMEGLGTSILDAMSMGVPVVATRVGGVPEMIRDGREGLLVPPNDPGRLAEAICAVLASGTLANRLGSAGRKRVKHFDITRTVAETEALYAEILSTPEVRKESRPSFGEGVRGG